MNCRECERRRAEPPSAALQFVADELLTTKRELELTKERLRKAQWAWGQALNVLRELSVACATAEISFTEPV